VNKTFVLLINRLIGRTGVSTIPDIFKDFQFGGKGRERQDLGKILAKLEHWIHLLHPKQPFDQSLQRIEFLGLKRKVVKTHLKKIRMGLLNDELVTTDDIVQEHDGDDDDLDFPNFHESEMEPNELARGSGATASTVTAPRAVVNQNGDNDDFPDDDDILAAMNEGFESVSNNAGNSSAKASYQHHQEEQDEDEFDEMEVDMVEDAFSKDMELALKRAEMAETQMEKEVEVTPASSNLTIDSSIVGDAIARAFDGTPSSVDVDEISSVPSPQTASVPEIISASQQTSSNQLEDTIAIVVNNSPSNEILSSLPRKGIDEDETLVVQSGDGKGTEEDDDNGICLDDLQDADDDEDMD